MFRYFYQRLELRILLDEAQRRFVNRTLNVIFETFLYRSYRESQSIYGPDIHAKGGHR